jgi:thioredoxin-related protein
MSRLAVLLAPVALLLAALSGSAVQAAELLMFREDGCRYCAEWERDIGEIYPRTAEARQAPLRRIDAHGAPPADVSLDGAIRYTPTFVLVEDGAEVDRIVGYPGENAFWSLLGEMLERLSQNPSTE